MYVDYRINFTPEGFASQILIEKKNIVKVELFDILEKFYGSCQKCSGMA